MQSENQSILIYDEFIHILKYITDLETIISLLRVSHIIREITLSAIKKMVLSETESEHYQIIHHPGYVPENLPDAISDEKYALLRKLPMILTSFRHHFRLEFENFEDHFGHELVYHNEEWKKAVDASSFSSSDHIHIVLMMSEFLNNKDRDVTLLNIRSGMQIYRKALEFSVNTMKLLKRNHPQADQLNIKVCLLDYENYFEVSWDPDYGFCICYPFDHDYGRSKDRNFNGHFIDENEAREMINKTVIRTLESLIFS